tara:strand:- start:30767 stop:32302 length:1536 start_codon:yes stop_codon:yes gene_type:complete
MSDTLLLKQKIETRKAQLKLMKEFGLLYYRPHDKQHQFHENADFRFRLARCGNRFGKSDMGVSEDLAFALGERPWYPESDPRRYIGIPKHPTKGLVIAADDDKIDEIFTGNGSKGHVGKIWKKIPKSLVIGTPKKSSSGTIVSIRIKGKYGESVIDFDTRTAFKNNPMGAESSDYDWVHVDEPIEEAHWKAVLRGLTDRGGKAWFTCTLIEQPWINDFFFPTIESQGQDTYIEIEPITKRKVRWVITGSIYDNPYLDQAAIEDFLNTLTEDERSCRISGIPLYLAGLVYKQFKRDVHILTQVPQDWKSYSHPPDNYTIHVSIDPHPRTPHAVLFAAVSPTGTIYIYDELWTTCTTKALAKQILKVISGRNVFHKLIDPMAFIIDQRNNTSMANDLASAGLIGFEKAAKDLKRGIPAVQDIFDTPGAIYVVPTVRTFLWEISRWAWADRHGVPTNKPVDKDDHMMECLYRLVLAGMIHIDFTDTSSSIPEETMSGSLAPLGNDFGSLDQEMI